MHGNKCLGNPYVELGQNYLTVMINYSVNLNLIKFLELLTRLLQAKVNKILFCFSVMTHVNVLVSFRGLVWQLYNIYPTCINMPKYVMQKCSPYFNRPNQ